MRLLLVEDDEALGRLVTAIAGKAGFTIDWVRTGAEAHASAHSHEYDLILLDLTLLDMTGDVLLKRLRDEHVCTPVIVLTARGLIADRITMLDLGADDYMVKPFDISELMARIRAIKRRTLTGADPSDVQHIGPLELSQASRCVRWHGKPVQLTAKEFDVLEVLVMRRPRLVSRAQLEEALYGWGDEVESNSIEVYIHFLRRKISPRVIVTARGKGYQLASAEAMAAEPEATPEPLSAA